MLEKRKKTFQSSRNAASQPTKPELPESLQPRAVNSWANIRDKLDELANSRGEWAGYPLSIEGLKLVVEKRHPLHATLNGAAMPVNNPPLTPRQRAAARSQDRRVDLPEVLACERWMYLMNTLAVAANECWSVQAEFRAMEKLRDMTTAQAFKCYVLCGCFLETSPRSDMVYLFRRGRPTIALRATKGGQMMPTAILCLHPIGYYERSWAGALVPTDDVIAHLTLMRGDERRFWGKANHHPIGAATAGL